MGLATAAGELHDIILLGLSGSADHWSAPSAGHRPIHSWKERLVGWKKKLKNRNIRFINVQKHQSTVTQSYSVVLRTGVPTVSIVWFLFEWQTVS